MSFHLVGYFPKKIQSATAAMGLPGIREIWSAGNCISGGPPDWVRPYRHNSLGLFDTPDLARSVVPAGEEGDYRVVGYRLWSEAFGEGPRLSIHGTDARPSNNFGVIGYDAVSSSHGHEFECSPLSCNGAAKEFAVNDRCLFETGDEAVAAARTFAAGPWEPGPYYVVEVLATEERR